MFNVIPISNKIIHPFFADVDVVLNFKPVL